MFIPIWLVVILSVFAFLGLLVFIGLIVGGLGSEEDCYSKYDLSLSSNPRQSREIYELMRELEFHKRSHENVVIEHRRALDELNDANNYIDHLVENIRCLHEKNRKLKKGLENSNQGDFVNDMHRYDMAVLKEELNQVIKENNELKIKLNKSDDLYQHVSHRLDCAVAQNSELEIKLKDRDKMISDNLEEIKKINNKRDDLTDLIKIASWINYSGIEHNHPVTTLEFNFQNQTFLERERLAEILRKITRRINNGSK